jgi:hypothetical protein
MPTDPEHLGAAPEPGTPTFRLRISDLRVGPNCVLRFAFLEIIIGGLCHRFVFRTHRGGLRALDRLSEMHFPAALLDEIRAAIASADIPEFDPLVVEVGSEEQLAEAILSADAPSVAAHNPQTAAGPPEDMDPADELEKIAAEHRRRQHEYNDAADVHFNAAKEAANARDFSRGLAEMIERMELRKKADQEDARARELEQQARLLRTAPRRNRTPDFIN